MQKETSDLAALFITLVAIAVCITLGIGIYTVGKRMATDAYIEQEIVSVDYTHILWALKSKMCALVLIFTGVMCVSISFIRSKLYITDTATVYDSTTNMVNECRKLNHSLVAVPGNYRRGDKLVVTRENNELTLKDYVFNVKEKCLLTTSNTVSKTTVLNLKGTIESVGNFYKVGDILVDKRAIHIKDTDSMVDMSFYIENKYIHKLHDKTVVIYS